MPDPSERLVARIERDFESARHQDVIAWLRGLKTEDYGGQNPERLQAALVLTASGDWTGFMNAVRLLRIDWRDLLVAGGLAHEDWISVLDRELPTPDRDPDAHRR